MPLFEVQGKFLKEDKSGLTYRFFQDAAKRVSLYIWQDDKTADSFEKKLKRFQLSYQDLLVEYKQDGEMKYARVDDGSNPMGVKRSPQMFMQTSFNEADRKEFDNFFTYCDRQSKNLVELQTIRSIIERFTEKN